MRVRDAVESDATAMAALADAPTDVMRNLVHDRTVRVAEPNGTPDPPIEGSDDESLLGFVSFDASPEAVHVTQIGGTSDACRELLTEPIRFATAESMAVELLLAPDRERIESIATSLGFERAGNGPRFGPEPTVRLRHTP